MNRIQRRNQNNHSKGAKAITSLIPRLRIPRHYAKLLMSKSGGATALPAPMVVTPMHSTNVHIPNKSVDFGHINIIEFLHSLFNLWLVGSQIYNEHQRVVVFDLLHSTLGGQRVFDNAVLIQPGATRDTLTRIFRPSLTLEGLGAVEMYRGVYFSLEFRVCAFQYGLLSLQGLILGLRGLARRDSLT